MNRRHLTAAILAASCLGACATLTQGLKQTVSVMTPGVQGAVCVLGNGVDQTFGSVTTPGSLEVSKSRKDLIVSCSKPGFESAQQRVSSAWSDRAKLQMPEGYVIDYVSGAMWNYPARIEIMLKPNELPPSPRSRGGGLRPGR